MVDKPRATERYKSFEEDLRALINKHSIVRDSNTPDFVLAAFLTGSLVNWNHAVNARKKTMGDI